jgi:hypothetical protein
MKKLELNQMEGLEGGGCGVLEGLAIGIGGSGVIFGAAALLVAASPLGWFTFGLGVVGYAVGIAAGVQSGSGCLNH